MSKKKRAPEKPGRRRTRSSGTRVREWVGGRLTIPVYIAEDEPYRPEMILWLELPEDLIVGQELIDPGGPPLSFTETLLHALVSPMVGAPRRPRRIRVSEAHLARELRGAVPDIEVVVAPTPELDAVIAQMVASMPAGGGELSYFEHGRVGADSVEALFQAASTLFRSAPWKLVQDSEVLRLDIPALGVEGACVSVIGALGESLGLVIFPSHLAMERFATMMEAGHDTGTRFDMGTSTLSLNFERGADLPVGMRREAAEHGWPVAGPAAYPWVQHRDRDGMMRPLEERDIRVVAACASGVAGFFARHGERLRPISAQPLSERFVGTDGIEVRLAMPYDAGGPAASGDDRRSKPPATRDDIGRSPAELHQIDGRPFTPPKLQNTDREDLLLTVDRFDFDPALRREIESCLATIDGVGPPEGSGSERRYPFSRPGNSLHRDWQSTLLGNAQIGDGKLRVETNSIERADRIRGLIEAACGGRIRHRTREHTDPVALMGRHEVTSGPGNGPSGPSSDEAIALILQFKRQHYADWADQPLPALGGKTPRAAVRTKAGREQVDLLLKEFEAGETRLPEGQRFDFSDLRRELGLRD